jgi:hypothetical protein
MAKKLPPYWLRTKFPCIVISEAKHYKCHFIANDHDDLVNILYNIFQTNNAYGCYFDLNKDEKTWYDEIMSADFVYEHFRALWDFIMSRGNAEYEKVQIIQPDTF